MRSADRHAQVRAAQTIDLGGRLMFRFFRGHVAIAKPFEDEFAARMILDHGVERNEWRQIEVRLPGFLVMAVGAVTSSAMLTGKKATNITSMKGETSIFLFSFAELI